MFQSRETWGKRRWDFHLKIKQAWDTSYISKLVWYVCQHFTGLKEHTGRKLLNTAKENLRSNKCTEEHCRMATCVVQPACPLPATDFSFGHSEQSSSCWWKICHIWINFVCAKTRSEVKERDILSLIGLDSKLHFDEQMDLKRFEFIIKVWLRGTVIWNSQVSASVKGVSWDPVTESCLVL